MTTITTWLAANWQTWTLAILAIDKVLIPLFPKATVFSKIATYLTDASSL